MTTYRIFAIVLIILTPIVAQILVSLLGLRRRFRTNMADLALPLFAYEIVLVSGKFFTHSFLFPYLIVMSILSIIIILFLLKKSKVFSFKRWLKFFWRAGFLLTFAFYIGTVVAIFLVK
ncbi:DUF3397 family protein [Streptococcus caprae]|uniref:DUF3397 family protein n=1 Tax=Streptococcus caprae TaxID=1640501 RepID=A0ABV8CVB8_9STRE